MAQVGIIICWSCLSARVKRIESVFVACSQRHHNRIHLLVEYEVDYLCWLSVDMGRVGVYPFCDEGDGGVLCLQALRYRSANC
jgi:hypothetical protein